MGFAPVVKKISKWRTENGKIMFISLVQQKMNEKVGEEVTIHDENEIFSILENILMTREENDEIIIEAVDYACSMLLGRINMHNRMTSIKDNMIRLQPRGTDDREKGCLPMTNISGSHHYSSFLKNQQQYR
tara:strand:- start:1869 stop:2261 length:393 start_codon:yes stop_codon:yes gene_type:complete